MSDAWLAPSEPAAGWWMRMRAFGSAKITLLGPQCSFLSAHCQLLLALRRLAVSLRHLRSNQRLGLGDFLIGANQHRQIQLGHHLLLFRNTAINKRANLGDELISNVMLGTREVGL